jgi:uncharacterized protein with PQ loop repeat
MDNPEWIEWGAIFVSIAASFLLMTQIWKAKSWKMNSVREVSLSTYIAVITALLFWGIHSFLVHRPVIISAWFFVVMLLLGRVAFKKFYEKKGKTR